MLLSRLLGGCGRKETGECWAVVPYILFVSYTFRRSATSRQWADEIAELRASSSTGLRGIVFAVMTNRGHPDGRARPWSLVDPTLESYTLVVGSRVEITLRPFEARASAEAKRVTTWHKHHRIGSWKRGRPRERTLPAQPGREHGDGDATTSGGRRQAEFARVLREREAARDRPAPRPPLFEHRIGDGEVIKDRFVRPLSRLVSRLTPGGIGRARSLGATAGRPRWSRICRVMADRSITEMTFIVPPQREQTSGSTS